MSRLRVEELLERAGAAAGDALEQGRLVAGWLAEPDSGTHLVGSMLRPKPESAQLLPLYQAAGAVDLGAASVERRGNQGVVTITRGERLNAENDETTTALETAVDLVLLDPGSEVGVLRGSVVDHPRYRGRRVFSSGLDLSELYAGTLSYLFFIVRELGFVAKILRGCAAPDAADARDPAEAPEAGDEWCEKPWIAGVETFAIGGGAQLLLVVDRVVAEREALLSLPASREGIIPGAAALRLPSYTGLAAARRSVLFDEEWPADSAEGRLLVDDLVERAGMDAAIDAAAAKLLATGPVSVIANRRALRSAREPLDSFRSFMSTYAIEQARCMASEALQANLERNWIKRRKGEGE